MKKLDEKMKKKLEEEKNELFQTFIQNKITLEQLHEKLTLIRDIEGMIQENEEKIFLDKREIRELAGKTWYISFPRDIVAYGWNKGTEANIYVEKSGKRIVLERKK